MDKNISHSIDLAASLHAKQHLYPPSPGGISGKTFNMCVATAFAYTRIREERGPDTAAMFISTLADENQKEAVSKAFVDIGHNKIQCESIMAENDLLTPHERVKNAHSILRKNLR